MPQEAINSRFQALQHHLQTIPDDSLAQAKAITNFQAAVYVHDTLHESTAASFLYEKVENRAVKSRVSSKFVPEPFDCVATLRQAKTPVMVIVSKQRYNLSGTLSYWKKALPNAKVAVLDKAHHFPWLDNPKPFYEQVNPFLQQFVKEEYASQKKVSRPVGRGYQRGKRP
ncbi:MAG: alpha/beta hydrolase [Spirosomataceae bacterium]